MTEIDLGQSAADYIMRELQGGRALSRALLDANLTGGRTWAYVTDQADKSAIENFSQAGVGGRTETETRLASFVQEYLQRGSTMTAAFEDIFAGAGDPVLAKPHNPPYFVVDNEVFDFIQGPGHSLTEIRRLLSAARTYRMVGVLGSTKHLEPGSVVARDVLEDLIKHGDHVIIGAWDGEGEIMWSLKEHPRP